MASKFSSRFRKPIAAYGVGVRSSVSQDDASVPTVTSGTGVPATSEPNGSIFLRTNATNGDDAIYSRIAGAWVAILGQTA